MAVVIGSNAGITGWALDRVPAQPGHGTLLLLAALTAGAAGCAEAARRLELPAGQARDLLAVWCLPASLLLPMSYALLVPLVAGGVVQARTGRRSPAEAVFRVSALGLAGAASAAVAGLLRIGRGGSWVTHPQALAGAVLCAGVFGAVSAGLTAGASRLREPLAGWRELLRDSGTPLPDACGAGAGVLLAIICSVSLPLLALTLAPVMMLQRGLLCQHLRAAARTDPATGLLNAAAWRREADAAVRQAARGGRALAVLMAGIDHFQRVCDTHGQLTGNRALVATTDTVRCQLRGSDLAGRFGGEFAVLLPGTSAVGACRVAERLRQEVAARPVRVTGGSAVTVTVSIGIAALADSGSDLLDLLTAADAALYRARMGGRDQVCLLPPPGHSSDPRT
ncbi:MAG: GGDEF domain-containing protein [Nocardiopsaceae bacterium]|jgi:diguanylate cyclase (GGDEF)-like protein|nr:GGDEF domain-containing protein [Nocardiopsaceae bacterium]